MDAIKNTPTTKLVKKPKPPKRPKPWRVAAFNGAAESSKASRASRERRPDYEHGEDNRRQVLTGLPTRKVRGSRFSLLGFTVDPMKISAVQAAALGLVASGDAHDRAHGQRDYTGQYLVPAAKDGRLVKGVASRARLYHKSQVWRKIVSHQGVVVEVIPMGMDSSFDGWWEMYRELSAAGIPLGGIRYSHQEVDVFRRDLYMPLDVKERAARRVRDALHQRTVQELSKEELELERKASAILRRAREEGLAGVGEDAE